MPNFEKKSDPKPERRTKRFFLASQADVWRKWDKVEKPNIPDEEKFTFSDILAMIIAVMSIVLPWALAIMGSLLVITFIISRLFV